MNYRTLMAVSAGIAVAALPCLSVTNYVSLSGTHVPPYTNWATAATDIQSAVLATVDDDVILVSNGTYVLASEIVVSNRILLKSIAGATKTAIDGNWPNATNQCVWLGGRGPTLDGFSVMRGAAVYGGGILCQFTGTVLNCIVVSNLSFSYAGGILCSYGGAVVNSLVVNNESLGPCGGIALYYGGQALNSTVLHNRAGTYAGGVVCRDFGEVINCVIQGNFAPEGPEYYNINSGMSYSHCCTTPAIPAYADKDGNITNDPKFINAAMGDYTLNILSPCINAGTNMAWMTNSFEIADNPRINDGSVDMGCFEVGGDVRVYGTFVWKQKTKTTAQGKFIIPLLKPYFATNYVAGIKDSITGAVLDGPHAMTPNRSHKTWKFKDKVTKVQVTYTENTGKTGTKTAFKYVVPTVIPTNSVLFLRKP